MIIFIQRFKLYNAAANPPPTLTLRTSKKKKNGNNRQNCRKNDRAEAVRWNRWLGCLLAANPFKGVLQVSGIHRGDGMTRSPLKKRAEKKVPCQERIQAGRPE